MALLGLFGASLLYGDGIITPAISVLSAIEGVHVATSALDHLVVPTSLVILFVLFWFQKRGTAKIGRLFGPAMMLWFAVIAVLGIAAIAKHPDVIAAINPFHAISFFNAEGLKAFTILGVVFLVVTGGEALYADMGHFGKRPIRFAWFAVVLPSFLLELFRARCIATERRVRRQQSVLPARTNLGTRSDGRVGNGGHRHRLASDHLGRVLVDQPSGSSGIFAASFHHSHIQR